MYNTYYSIADVVIQIISPFPFFAHNGVEFVCEETDPDYVFTFSQVNDIPHLMAGSRKIAELLWAHEYRKKDGTEFRAFLWKDTYYSALSFCGETEGVCYYASAEILAEQAKLGFELLMYLCLEKILLRHGALTLHSSHIRYRGQGIVFSAPSGTGKSTQAELWEKYAGARVMNGDRSVLRKKDNQWFVYGCPMCGTSDIHISGREPLSNVIMLNQGKENNPERISPARAFRLMYSQVTISNWNVKNVDTSIELLNDLVQNVPVWHYSCTKEEDAVWILKEALGL